MPLHIATPLIPSLALSARTGLEVWLKLEALQPSGSFKLRGVGLACETHARRGAKRFISSSGGNAGIAVACAGRSLGLPVEVVVPQTTSARARELIALHGARLTVHGASWHEANELAQSMVGEADAFIHPFDDPLLWDGHATLVDEVAQARAATGFEPDAVLLSVGGGGLLCGVVQGLHRNGWAGVPVLAAETRGADSLAQSVAAGQRVSLPAITSVATSLGARQVCEQAWAWTTRHAIHPAVVSDAQALAACVQFMDDHRLVVEPACGAALAALEVLPTVLPQARRVLVVVCGGVTATATDLWAAAPRGAVQG
ncbi:MAG TPA: pyridoxal-phosphate dependent enzyme [Burkholderiaceae bacterium]|nr:pyridoxal-phosphate dependent enzyme [Burkholderiaceae bacterium]